MEIVVPCATSRGLRCLEAVAAALPEATLTVVSFREEPWEPPFFADIEELASSRGFRLIETRSLAGSSMSGFWESTVVDLMIVVSWRYMIPRDVYELPRRGTFVLHDSLLPKYRGFAPTQWAMINGESTTGVSLFRIAEAVDAGPIVDQLEIPIAEGEVIGEVMERVTSGYIELINRNLRSLLDGRAPLREQDESAATYTCKRLPEDNRVDWGAATEAVYNLIRAATTPYPGAFTTVAGEKLIVWSADRLGAAPGYVGRVPGRVIQVKPGEGVVVLTGDGALLLREVQLAGKPRTCAADVLTRISLTLGR